MIIPYNKNITKLKNNLTIGITITLQCLLQSTKHALIIYYTYYQDFAESTKQQIVKAYFSWFLTIYISPFFFCLIFRFVKWWKITLKKRFHIYIYIYIYILALCSCDVRLNKNSYINSFFLLIYLKLDNRIDNKNK